MLPVMVAGWAKILLAEAVKQDDDEKHEDEEGSRNEKHVWLQGCA